MLSMLVAIVLLPTALPEPPAAPALEFYADRLSYRPGEEVGLCVSTTAPAYQLEIARVGGQRQIVRHSAGLPGQSHAVPPDASARGCRWPVAHRFTIPADWKSGYYEVRLRAATADGKED